MDPTKVLRRTFYHVNYFFTSTLVVVKMISLVQGHSHGVPCQAQHTMRPSLIYHGTGIDAAREPHNPPPYTLTVTSAYTGRRVRHYRPGGVYRVTLRSNPESIGSYFRGFLLQARLASGTGGIIGHLRAGRFIPEPERWSSHGIQTQDCYPRFNNSITHTNGNRKYEISVLWRIVRNLGPIQFIATVVQDKTVFWKHWQPRSGFLLPKVRRDTATSLSKSVQSGSAYYPFPKFGLNRQKGPVQSKVSENQQLKIVPAVKPKDITKKLIKGIQHHNNRRNNNNNNSENNKIKQKIRIVSSRVDQPIPGFNLTTSRSLPLTSVTKNNNNNPIHGSSSQHQYHHFKSGPESLNKPPRHGGGRQHPFPIFPLSTKRGRKAGTINQRTFTFRPFTRAPPAPVTDASVNHRSKLSWTFNSNKNAEYMGEEEEEEEEEVTTAEIPKAFTTDDTFLSSNNNDDVFNSFDGSFKILRPGKTDLNLVLDTQQLVAVKSSPADHDGSDVQRLQQQQNNGSSSSSSSSSRTSNSKLSQATAELLERNRDKLRRRNEDSSRSHNPKPHPQSHELNRIDHTQSSSIIHVEHNGRAHIDFCASRPCYNGGTCENDRAAQKFNCHCREFFAGFTCLEINYCRNNFCSSGSTCLSIPGAGSYQCICLPEYQGKLCNLHCPAYLCQNGGSCQVTERGDYSCSCPASHYGDSCQFEYLAPTPLASTETTATESPFHQNRRPLIGSSTAQNNDNHRLVNVDSSLCSNGHDNNVNRCGTHGRCVKDDGGGDGGTVVVRCHCDVGWYGSDCKRPCLDLYHSCVKWDAANRCRDMRKVTKFFDENCPVTCNQCEPGPGPRKVPNVEDENIIPPHFHRLTWLTGEWLSTDDLITLSIRPGALPLFGKPSLKFIQTVREWHKPDEETFIANGYLRLHESRQPRNDTVSIALQTASNRGFSHIEEGVLDDYHKIIKLSLASQIPSFNRPSKKVREWRLLNHSGQLEEYLAVKYQNDPQQSVVRIVIYNKIS